MSTVQQAIADRRTGVVARFFASPMAGMTIAIAAMFVGFAFAAPNFFLPANFLNILIASSTMGLVAVGESYLIIAGQIDLSPGAVSAFSGMVIAVMLKNSIAPMISVPAALLVGAGIGYLNATLVNRLKLQPFIATLATSSLFRGLAFIINDGKTEQIFNKGFLALGLERYLGLPISVWVLLIALAAFTILLRYTTFGRSVYIIGGNPVAARLAGINARRLVTKLYVMCAALTSLGGVMLASRMNAGQPTASNGLEFDAITATVLGGVAFSGGSGSMPGTILGIFILVGFNNGLLIMNVPSFWQYVARGGLLVVALSFDTIRQLIRRR
ncbi:MAG TPA: ABC transporter permease [Spirochaetia bacterium]|nr:ABC transporter permease [Spirochaetia bacterium]